MLLLHIRNTSKFSSIWGMKAIVTPAVSQFVARNVVAFGVAAEVTGT